MKIDTLRSGGQSQGGLDASGGTLSGPLMLSRDPQVPLEAATKRYIDNGVQALNASNIVAGTLPITRLPAFSGDVTSEAGQNTMNLSNTGVTAGEYGKALKFTSSKMSRGSKTSMFYAVITAYCLLKTDKQADCIEILNDYKS